MKEKVSGIIEILKTRYADAPCALHYKKDYELMIAVRLSACPSFREIFLP